jgi:hypothetical protein
MGQAKLTFNGSGSGGGASTVKHTVTFNTNGGSPATWTEEVNDGQAVTQPSNPTKTSASFTGWKLGSATGAAYDFSTPVTEDITLFAKYM